jgi:C4-type Zn-finger protein
MFRMKCPYCGKSAKITDIEQNIEWDSATIYLWLECNNCNKESGYCLEGEVNDYVDNDYDPIEEVHL